MWSVSLAFAIPIYQPWRTGDDFKVGTWSISRHYRWLCPLAVIEIGATTLIALMPSSSGGVPWMQRFSWKYVNYTPLVAGGTLLVL